MQRGEGRRGRRASRARRRPATWLTDAEKAGRRTSAAPRRRTSPARSTSRSFLEDVNRDPRPHGPAAEPTRAPKQDQPAGPGGQPRQLVRGGAQADRRRDQGRARRRLDRQGGPDPAPHRTSTLKFEVPEAERQKAGGLQTGDLRFDMTIGDLNEEQTITAPAERQAARGARLARRSAARSLGRGPGAGGVERGCGAERPAAAGGLGSQYQQCVAGRRRGRREAAGVRGAHRPVTPPEPRRRRHVERRAVHALRRAARRRAARRAAAARRRDPHGRHRRRVRRGRGRPGARPRARRAWTATLHARRRGRPRLLRGRARGREGLPALHRPAAARAGASTRTTCGWRPSEPRAPRRSTTSTSCCCTTPTAPATRARRSWEGMAALRDAGLTTALGVAPGPANGFTLDVIDCFERFGDAHRLGDADPQPDGAVARRAARSTPPRATTSSVITRVVDYGGLFWDDVLPGHEFAERDHRAVPPAGLGRGGAREARAHAPGRRAPRPDAAAARLRVEPRPRRRSRLRRADAHPGARAAGRSRPSAPSSRASRRASPLTAEEVAELRAHRRQHRLDALKGATPDHEGPPLPDRWPLDEQLAGSPRAGGSTRHVTSQEPALGSLPPPCACCAASSSAGRAGRTCSSRSSRSRSRSSSRTPSAGAHLRRRRARRDPDRRAHGPRDRGARRAHRPGHRRLAQRHVRQRPRARSSRSSR